MALSQNLQRNPAREYCRSFVVQYLPPPVGSLYDERTERQSISEPSTGEREAKSRIQKIRDSNHQAEKTTQGWTRRQSYRQRDQGTGTATKICSVLCRK